MLVSLRCVLFVRVSAPPPPPDHLSACDVQYRAEYLYWDVLETVRKLYLVLSDLI